MGGRLFPKVPGSGLQRWLVTIAETDRKYQVGSGKGFLTLVMLLLPRQTSGRVSQEQGCGVCPCARGASHLLLCAWGLSPPWCSPFIKAVLCGPLGEFS